MNRWMRYLPLLAKLEFLKSIYRSTKEKYGKFSLGTTPWLTQKILVSLEIILKIPVPAEWEVSLFWSI
jgi:hypothetical protein